MFTYLSTNLNLLFRNFRLHMEYIISLKPSEDIFCMISPQASKHEEFLQS